MTPKSFTRSSWSTNIVVMRNITVTLDDEVARWVRVWAAKHDTSVSRMLGEYLTERMRTESGYEAAMNGYLAGKPRRLRKQPTPYPNRGSLHER